jgi:hypothetical protein
MGMYDRFVFLETDHLTPGCAAGHHFVDVELQTKDFDCNLDTYYVSKELLYIEYGGLRTNIVTPQKRERVDNALITTWQTRAALMPFTGTANGYTSCHQCLPVLELRESAWGDPVQEHYPWCEYQLAFRDGKLWAVTPVRVETRDEIRAKWPGSIPDTDHIAQKHFERLRIQNETYEKTYGRKPHR